MSNSLLYRTMSLARSKTLSAEKRPACKIAYATLISTILVGAVSASLTAQSANRKVPQTSSPKFEVASVRESPFNSRSRNPGILMGDDHLRGTLFSVNAFLIDYIKFAYKDSGLDNARLGDSLPQAIRDKQYAIEARTATEPSTDELRLMMKDLLAERFSLKAHFEESKEPVYYLSLIKPGVFGHGLSHHPSEDDCSEKNAPAEKACGMRVWPDRGLIHVKFVGVTIQQLETKLTSLHLGAIPDDPMLPTLDKTGLQGLYDVEFLYGPVILSGQVWQILTEETHFLTR